MQLPEFTRSTTMRWTVLVAGIFAAFTVALLGFVYLKTKQDLTLRSDRAIALQMASSWPCHSSRGSTRSTKVCGRIQRVFGS